MATLKIKVKKTLFKRKMEGVTVAGYIGRVVSTGKKTFDEIARDSAKNTTLHPKEASLAAELLLEGISEHLTQGYIIDLGPLGTLYPAVKSKWDTDADNLALSDMQPKVNYKASEGITAAVKGASLSWATAKDETEGTETPTDDDDITDQTGGNSGGSTGPIDLEG